MSAETAAMGHPPRVIVLAGPNGAGKSTVAAYLLPETMAFVNADELAKNMPGYPSIEVDRQAARLALETMNLLEGNRSDFAVETTLASRSLAARLVRLRESGYFAELYFLLVPSADLAVQRVALRVRRGGHSIPEETIRRRYAAGIKNFFSLYQPLVDRWDVRTNLVPGLPHRIAQGKIGEAIEVVDESAWDLMQKRALYE